MWYDYLEEVSKPVKHQKQAPTDDTSDFEHLLDDQPISEFILRVHVCFVVYFCPIPLVC